MALKAYALAINDLLFKALQIIEYISLLHSGSLIKTVYTISYNFSGCVSWIRLNRREAPMTIASKEY
jgi:hypothetical protein